MNINSFISFLIFISFFSCREKKVEIIAGDLKENSNYNWYDLFEGLDLTDPTREGVESITYIERGGYGVGYFIINHLTKVNDRVTLEKIQSTQRDVETTVNITNPQTGQKYSYNYDSNKYLLEIPDWNKLKLHFMSEELTEMIMVDDCNKTHLDGTDRSLNINLINHDYELNNRACNLKDEKFMEIVEPIAEIINRYYEIKNN